MEECMELDETEGDEERNDTWHKKAIVNGELGFHGEEEKTLTINTKNEYSLSWIGPFLARAELLHFSSNKCCNKNETKTNKNIATALCHMCVFLSQR